MKKRSALSPIGIALAIVMLLGVLMIISAPVIVENSKKSQEETQVPPPAYNEENVRYNNAESMNDRISEYEAQVRYLESRISDLEAVQQQNQNSETRSSKRFNCTLESALDADGETIQLNRENYNNPSTQYVFVCSKK